MYGLPEDFDGSSFVGKRLDEVSFAEYVLFLNFEKDLWIRVESTYEFTHEKVVERQKLPVSVSSLMQLVGCTVIACEGDSEGTLTLRFDKGFVFRCFDDIGNYECYCIRSGTREIYV